MRDGDAHIGPRREFSHQVQLPRQAGSAGYQEAGVAGPRDDRAVAEEHEVPARVALFFGWTTRGS